MLEAEVFLEEDFDENLLPGAEGEAHEGDRAVDEDDDLEIPF